MRANKLPLGVRILLGVISVLLCLVLLVATVASMLAADVRILTSKNNIQKLLDKTIFASPSLYCPADGIPAIRFGSVTCSGEPHAAAPGFGEKFRDELVDNVYDSLVDHFGDEFTMSRDQLKDLAEKSTVTEYVSEKAASLVNDMLTGEDTTSFPKEEIAEQIKANAGLVKKEFDYDLTEEQISDLADAVVESPVVRDLEQEGLTAVTGDPSSAFDEAFKGDGKLPFAAGIFDGVFEKGGKGPIKTLKSNVQENIKSPTDLLLAMRSFTDAKILTSCLLACLVLCLLVLLVNLRQIHLGVRRIGITFTVAALPTILPGLSAAVLANLWDGSGAGFFRQTVNMTLGVHIGVLALGIVLIVLSFVMRMLFGRKKAHKTVPKAEPVFAAPAAPAMKPLEVNREAPAEADDTYTAPAAEPAAGKIEEESAESQEELPTSEEAEIPQDIPVLETEPQEAPEADYDEDTKTE